MSEIGKLIIFIGVVLIIFGIVLTFAPKIPFLGKLQESFNVHVTNKIQCFSVYLVNILLDSMQKRDISIIFSIITIYVIIIVNVYY